MKKRIPKMERNCDNKTCSIESNSKKREEINERQIDGAWTKGDRRGTMKKITKLEKANG